MDRGISLLILEDSPEEARRLEQELRKSGLPVQPRRVETRTAFLQELNRLKPDVILGDLGLHDFPAMSALEIARQRTGDIPVILMAGTLTDDAAAEALRKGAVDCIPKASPVRLIVAVERALVESREHVQRRDGEQKLRESRARLQKAMEGAIHATASIVESRDPYTAGHQRRVAELAFAIAREMGLTETGKAAVLWSGVIHDVGKSAVPSDILNKTGTLTEIEWSILKTHPIIGYNILKNIEFPWPLAAIVLQHHERLNGSGYPKGIRENDILLEARILAVADVVEAMISHRVYRPALGIQEALVEITSQKSILYDPSVSEVCANLFARGNFSFDELEETPRKNHEIPGRTDGIRPPR